MMPSNSLREASSFDVSKLLSVTFLAESAVDGGGPRRELFRLLLADLFSISGLFIGYPSAVTTSHNVVALQYRDSAVAGKIVGASIGLHHTASRVQWLILLCMVKFEAKLG